MTQQQRKIVCTFTSFITAVLFSCLSGCSWFAPDFTDYKAGAERKKAFFDYFTPIVQEENQRILKQRSEVEEAIATGNVSWLQSYKLGSLANDYKLKQFDADKKEHLQTLLRRVDIIPPSMALAQAANESAWGTSRFAQDGNNYFGQWCYEKGCGLVPKNRNAGATHEVATFASPEDSVHAYMANINTHKSYKQLRDIRAQQRNNEQNIQGLTLIQGLTGYSERGGEYIAELHAMITQNKLQLLDK